MFLYLYELDAIHGSQIPREGFVLCIWASKYVGCLGNISSVHFPPGRLFYSVKPKSCPGPNEFCPVKPCLCVPCPISVSKSQVRFRYAFC